MKIKTAAYVFTVFSVALSATPSFARLADAFKNLPTEVVREAVHIPTGCMAKITMDDTHVVTAQIIDPLCLPDGIKARAVPGGKNDFSIVKPR